MAWYRCMGYNPLEMSTLAVQPYNVVNGSYTTANNEVTYVIEPTSGYEGLSIALLNLEVGKTYLVTFDVTVTSSTGNLARGAYSWKTCVRDGSVTSYNSGNDGKWALDEGQYYLPNAVGNKVSYGFLVTAQSETTTLLFLTADAYVTINLKIDNFKYVDKDKEEKPLFTPISNIRYISQTDFDNLASKDDETLYCVYFDGNGNLINDFQHCLIWKKYQGNTRIVMKKDYLDYHFWYEGCNLPIDNYSNLDGHVNPNITFNDFNSRDWQLEFKIREVYQIEEQAIMGDDSGGVLEMYLNSSNNLNIYGNMKSSTNAVSDVIGHDIKLVHTKDTTVNQIEVYKDGTLIETWICRDYTSSANMQLFNYRGEYPFQGFFEYIGFKWLD